jgi:hypothetical protein
MGKFNAATDLDNYASSSSYFSLPDDGDEAIMHFMYNSVDDIDGYAVHRVKVNGYDRNVNCLRDYSDPLDKCPLCEARYRTIAKFFVNLYNAETGEVKVWERGQNFYPQMKEDLGMLKNLATYPVRITRHGKKGDTNTTYELLAVEPSLMTYGTVTMEDFPDVEDPLGTYILDKTYDELVTYVQTGSFETGDNNPVNRQDNTEVRRRRDVSSSPVSRRNTSNDVPL